MHGAHEAEPEVVVPIAGIVPVAVRRPAVDGIVVPSAAPNDTIRAPLTVTL